MHKQLIVLILSILVFILLPRVKYPGRRSAGEVFSCVGMPNANTLQLKRPSKRRQLAVFSG